MALPPKVYTWLCGVFASAYALVWFFMSGIDGHQKGLGSIIFGYDLGVIAGVLPAPDFIVCLSSGCTQVASLTKFSAARYGFTIQQSQSSRTDY